MRKGSVLYPVLSVVIIVVCALVTTFAFAAGPDGASLQSLDTEGWTNRQAEKIRSTEVPEGQKAELIKSYGKLPLYFIENTGQVDGEVSYYERGAGHATFFTREGVVISLARSEVREVRAESNVAIKDLKREKPSKVFSEAVALSFVGARKDARITAKDSMPGKVNYFIGNDRSKWRTNIPTYGAVTYKDVYKNIDIMFYGNNKSIEHDVIVRPGGDPSVVKFAYKGIKGLRLTEEGDLEVALEQGKIIEKRPVVYQEIKGQRVAIDSSFRILKGRDGAFTYGFDVASYDRTKDLVIDPVLVYSTYLGGSDWDSAEDIAVDSSGAAYVVGSTLSVDFPLSIPLQGALLGGTWDIFITKINSTGTAFVYSTYLGGSDTDRGLGIAIDSTGATYVTGYTLSTDFPLNNPIQGVLKGGMDTFIAKLTPDGSAVIYSTYIGGSWSEWGYGITVDSTGAAYVTGATDSSDFPLVNPIQGTFKSKRDAFVTKIDPTGMAYAYSTYLGGSGLDWGYGIAVDNAGAAYVTGVTEASDFPLLNPIQGVSGGGPYNRDAFVTKIDPSGAAFVYSTYLGGSNEDLGMGITVDDAGAVYVTGNTRSNDFPIMNPIRSFAGLQDAFVTKINSSGAGYVYSTYLGGSDLDSGRKIAVNSTGVVYVTGYTHSGDFPLVHHIQGCGGNAFITSIDPAGAAYVYSTCLGAGSTYGNGIDVDSTGMAYVCGMTDSINFPLKAPIQKAYGGGLYDAFITKISTTPFTLFISPDATSVVRGSTLSYTVSATNYLDTRSCLEYWENVSMPDGSIYPPSGELFGPYHLCLDPGASRMAHLTHSIPIGAPLGSYTFNAYIGAGPAFIENEAHFNFDLTAFGPLPNHPATSWRLLENGFRK